MTDAISSQNITGRQVVAVLGAPIDVIDWHDAIDRVRSWASRNESRVVCICNAHSVVTARTTPQFARVLREADMATPDGTPVAWMMRRLGWRGQRRINGPDLMWHYLADAEKTGQSVFFFGALPSTLDQLQNRVRATFPGLRIAGAYSPPFRALTDAEDQEIVDLINASGAQTVWVSLGCPKQEQWMWAHRGRVNAVMLGVGAAFDFHAGVVRRAPEWMQRNGLEWLHRLASEPKRLWRRYFVTNTLMLWYSFGQLLSNRSSK